MKGRKRLPDYLRSLTGNPGKRPLNVAAPLPSETSLPPAWLNGEALAHWHRIVPALENAGRMNAFASLPLARYCVALADWEEVTALAARTGPRPKKSQWRTLVHWRAVKKSCEATMRYFEGEFGLTPVSASRIAAPVGPPPAVVEFERFLANKPGLQDPTVVTPASEAAQ